MKTLFTIALSALILASANSYAAVRGGEESKEAKTFTVTKGGQLEVNISGGDIQLNTWDKDEVNVVVDGIDEEDMDYVKMTQSGNTVRIDYRPRWNWSGDVLFKISLPAQFDADVRTSGGNIDVRGSMKGKLTGSTSGGDIRTADIEGTTDLKTSGGDIWLGTVSGEADVKTSGGEIRVEKVGKSLKASTAGGDVEVGDVGGDAILSTSGGEVKVGKVSGNASLRTAGGDIDLSSASGTVEAKTAGGNVRLQNITGSIDAKTAGGDVEAELIPSGKGPSELRSSGGNVVLSVPSTAKATIDATIRLRGGWMRHEDEYDIHSDFKEELKTTDKHEQEIHAVYQLNGGGDRITLETTNGNIEIRRLGK
ncbi:MAG TPA: DUF4097 family beta strand repeat-containing protein [Bacteroidota bacterium]|nr:DUF4097 family beta strand repeat-containing protein [Bacteroidota bacterium]